MLRRLLLTQEGILTLIALNAIVIFLLSFPSLAHNRWLLWFDQVFLLLFVLESLWKMREQGVSGYFSRGWNVFDFSVVLISLPSLFLAFGLVHDLSIVIVLRLFRFFRMLRLLRFVPDIRLIINGLLRALRASVMVLFVMVVSNFILAIFSVHLFAELDPEHFGNPLRAFFAMFEVMTLEGWIEVREGVTRALNDGLADYLVQFFFLALVLVGGIFGLSLANAIFVDEMTLDNNQSLERKIDELQAQVAALRDMLEANR